MIGALILLAALMISAYAALVVLLGGIVLLPTYCWYFNLMVHEAGPLPLLVLASVTVMKLRQARLIGQQRQGPASDPFTVLARGGHILPQTGSEGVSWVERIAWALIWLALICIPVWLGWPLPLLWSGALMAIWMLIRLLLTRWEE